MSNESIIKQLFQFIRLTYPDIDENVNEEYWEDGFKQQIIDAHQAGVGDGYDFLPAEGEESAEIDSEDYYNQTFKP